MTQAVRVCRKLTLCDRRWLERKNTGVWPNCFCQEREGAVVCANIQDELNIRAGLAVFHELVFIPDHHFTDDLASDLVVNPDEDSLGYFVWVHCDFSSAMQS